jgi:hypothetical protein
VGAMSDRELQWIPDETPQAIGVRTRAIGGAVLAVGCIVIGIVIWRLVAGIPTATGSGPPGVVSAPSAKKPPEPNVERPSFALKDDIGKATQKPSISPQAEPKTYPPPIVLLNPGTAVADTNPSSAREETRARARQVREPSDASRETRGPQAAEDRRDMLSPPARDYQSLREYMFSR